MLLRMVEVSGRDPEHLEVMHELGRPGGNASDASTGVAGICVESSARPESTLGRRLWRVAGKNASVSTTLHGR